MSLPRTTKAIVVQKVANAAKQQPVYHDAILTTKPIPSLKPNQLLVRVTAAGFNRRDVWIRAGQYPAILFGGTLGSDAVGFVVGSADPQESLLNKRVLLTPMRGWESHPDAPEDATQFGVVGGGKFPAIGYFSEYVVVDRDEVVLAPEHLDDVHAAALPLGSLTAWRAAAINARVERGQNVLVTGIGGGVAILALHICVAKGANVYVTSGSEDKIKKAMSWGAKGGVLYKSKRWPNELQALLKETPRPFLDSVIDSGGGDIMGLVSNVLRPGGPVVCYGMTTLSNIPFSMRQVLRNQRLIGSTMGSKKDFRDAIAFFGEHKLVPMISHVLDGLESAEQGFELLRKGEQFGKVVIKLREGEKAKL